MIVAGLPLKAYCLWIMPRVSTVSEIDPYNMKYLTNN